MKQLKVGIPLYLNTLPILSYLDTEPSRFEVVLKVPRVLNDMLRNGKIQASLSSSVVFAKEFEDYLILPDISISAVGEVKSVIFCHNISLEELHEKPIAITPETESSFCLLRVLFEKFLKIKPRYTFLSCNWKDLSPEEKSNFYGYLAIGDEALTLQLNAEGMVLTDLAKLWLEFTNLPFVFAILVVKKALAEEFEEELKEFAKAIYCARARGLANLKAVASKAHLNLPEDFVFAYLTHLEYDFSGLKQRAFLTFCKYLKDLKVINEVPKLEFFKV